MYTAVACVVLFDARGTPVPMSSVMSLVCAIQSVLLAICYVPSVYYRPQEVDALCSDLLVFAAHIVGIVLVIRDPTLQFACALHSLCYNIEKRYLDRGSSSYIMFIHTLVAMLLLAAYVYGPRITDLFQFMLSAVWPHVMEVAAVVLIRTHKLAVAYVTDIS